MSRIYIATYQDGYADNTPTPDPQYFSNRALAIRTFHATTNSWVGGELARYALKDGQFQKDEVIEQANYCMEMHS